MQTKIDKIFPYHYYFMKNVSVNNSKGKKKRYGSLAVRLISRNRFRFVAADDFLQGIISILPSSSVDKDWALYVAHSYHDGLRGDWDRVGDDMWLSISKYASNNSK